MTTDGAFALIVVTIVLAILLVLGEPDLLDAITCQVMPGCDHYPNCGE